MRFLSRFGRCNRAVGSVALLIVVVFALYQNSLGCTFRAIPLADFDDNEVVFVGKVVSYTEPIDIPERTGSRDGRGGERGSWYTAVGLKIKVKEGLNIVEKSNEYFEVFPFNYSSVCAAIGLTAGIVQNNYPLGSDVAVVATKAKRLPDRSSDGSTRLEIAPAKGSILVLSRMPVDSRPSLSSFSEYSHETGLGILRFEVRKDLFRLKKERNAELRHGILNRLIGFVGGWRLIDYYFLLKTYAKSSIEADELYLKMLQRNGLDQKRIKSHLECLEQKLKKGTLVPGTPQQC
ncbi:MAG: hypothetical protein ABL959_14730 [Pyrinomonadaceae bacterium]